MAAPGLSLLLGLAADRLLGEPRRHHPLVYFGHWAQWLEQRLNPPSVTRSDVAGRAAGVLALLLAVVPPLWLSVWLLHALPGWAAALLSLAGLYAALGLRSLGDHARAIAEPLAAADLPAARVAVAQVVSRDCSTLDQSGIARAATESVLENGADAVFASLFWFALAGLPGVLLHRLVNTLDAMWGYRNQRFVDFGWAAARLDDVLGWLPARLTAATYWLLAPAGNRPQVWRCWQQQGRVWGSPNAGPVMAAGAAALGVTLGGRAHYHGRVSERPLLGAGPAPQAATLAAAMTLVQRGAWLWALLWWLAGAVR